MTDYVKTGRPVSVTYTAAGGKNHALTVRPIASAGSAGGGISEDGAKNVEGKVKSIAGAMLTLAVDGHDMTFAIDRETDILARGASRATKKGGVPITDIVHDGDLVRVAYRAVNGSMKACRDSNQRAKHHRAVGYVATRAESSPPRRGVMGRSGNQEMCHRDHRIACQCSSPYSSSSRRASAPRRVVALSPEEMESFLLNAPIVANKGFLKGVTKARRVTLSDGRTTHDAQVQDVDIALPIFEVGPKHTEVNFKDTYRYNIAAYRLARLLRPDNVPMSGSNA